MTIIHTPKIGVAGYFKIEAHHADDSGNEVPGSRRVLADWFPNLITNGGLDMLSDNTFMNAVQVGTSTATPAITDTSLGARVAGVAAQSFAQGTPGAANVYSSVVGTYVFALGAAAGNLAEIGAAPASTGAVFSRARILDGSGNPTTLTVTAIDILTVTYELRLYIDQTDVTGSFVVNSITYNTVSRPCYMGANKASNWRQRGLNADGQTNELWTYASTSTLGAVTSVPSNNSGTSGYNGGLAGYTNGNYYRDIVWNFSVLQGNATGGVGAVAMANYNDRWALPTQVSFSPPLPKDNTKTMTITIRCSWGRYTP